MRPHRQANQGPAATTAFAPLRGERYNGAAMERAAAYLVAKGETVRYSASAEAFNSMTLQVAMIGSDGWLIASDRRLYQNLDLGALWQRSPTVSHSQD